MEQGTVPLMNLDKPSSGKTIPMNPHETIFTVDVGGKVWQMGQNVFMTLVNEAKNAMHDKGQCAIVAVGKGNVWTMEKTTFSSRAALDRGVNELLKKGMQVKTVRV